MKIKLRASIFRAPFVAGLAMLWPSIHLFADESHSNPVPLQQLADIFEASYAEETPPEGARMLLAILRGSRMGPGEGWFGPSQSRYDFAWLVEQHGGSSEGVPRSRFAGSGELFAVLDRNRDGVIEPGDLDWSDDNPYVQLSYALNRIFRRLDADGSGGLSRADWEGIFTTAAGDSDTMSARDFAATLLAGEGGGFSPGDAPTTETLLKGLLAGEIGSMVEGPKVGEHPPVFELPRPQGGDPLSLSALLGEKPLVLVFGNFTCGPFRSFYPAIDSLQAVYGDRVNFLMVYVREAHPENGWKMASNAKAGVSVVQPQSVEERAAVARAFCSRLEPRMPVVVDDLNDSVGHAYSGMPARLYLIDRESRIAFKSGRGPFGFKPAELEQAIAMTLLESFLDTVNTADALDRSGETTDSATGP